MHDAKEVQHPRRATSEKLKRDAENLKAYARFVFVLKESGIEVIDNGARRAQGLPYAKIIAILGPAQHDGEHLPECNLLEIGYSRARPYASTELSKCKNGDRSRHRRFLKQRPRVRALSKEELSRVYPHIAECMRVIILELSAHWTTRTWHIKKKHEYAKGHREVGRGIYFTARNSDRLLHRQLIMEDVRHRKDMYILRHASWVRWLSKKYKFSRQLRKHARARQIADMLSQDHYTPFYRAVLCRHFKEDSRVRILLDSIVEAFNIDVSLTDLEAYAFEPSTISLPSFENLRCYRLSEQPTVHAREATVFEIFLEREYRISIEERSCHEQTDDDEVPF